MPETPEPAQAIAKHCGKMRTYFTSTVTKELAFTFT